MKVGDKVTVIYDPRPIAAYRELPGEVIKITQNFYRIKTDDGTYNELFDKITGYARGWNTLRFE